MIGVGEQFQRPIDTVYHGNQQLCVSQGVAGALQKKHWNPHRHQMEGPFVGRLVGGMQREAKEQQAEDFRQRCLGLGLGGHPTAERFPAGEQRQAGRSGLDRRADRCAGQRRAIGPFRTVLHVGELKSQRGDVSVA